MNPRPRRAPSGAGRPRPQSPTAARPATRKDPLGLLVAILVCFQILYMTVPTDILDPPPEPTALDLENLASSPLVNMMAPNPVSRFIKLALIAISAVVIIKRASMALLLLRRLNLFFRIFLVLVPVSYLWSISPGDTLARYVSVMSEVAICMAFCLGGWHAERFQKILRPTVTVLLVGSVLLGLYDPNLVMEHGGGTLKNAWHGLTSQKNQFGQLSGFGVLLWLHAAMSKQSKLWLALPGMALSFTCVLLSRSSTSLMATTFASMFMLLAMRTPGSLRRYIPYLVTTLSAAVLTYALAVLNIIPGTGILLEPIAALTGKDTTFSARSIIWDIIKEHIQLSPWVGSGYGAYWIGAVPWSPSAIFLSRMYFYPTESHNGYLEIVNDLGYLGLVCLFGFLLTYVRQCLQLAKVDRAQGFLYLGLFFQQAIVNLSETAWLAINAGFVFFVMTLAVTCLGRGLLDRDLLLGNGSVRQRFRAPVQV